MTDTLVSFKTLKLAREKGFHTPTEEMYSNITQSLLAKWLRDTHGINVSIFIEGFKKYWWEIDIYKGSNDGGEGHCHDILYFEYETALEYGLQEALNLIKS